MSEQRDLQLPLFVSGEFDLLNRIKEIGRKNTVWRSYIGMGYYQLLRPQHNSQKCFRKPRMVCKKSLNLAVR